MHVPYYQVDAFTDRLFGGNPAGVCILEKWLENKTLLDIAAENKHSETAFLVSTQKGFVVRWFTPAREIDLCGHATLASAFVLFTEHHYPHPRIEFRTPHGEVLSAASDDAGRTVMLDFPARPGIPVAVVPDALVRGLKLTPRAVLKHRDYLAVFDRPEQVEALRPDFESLRELDDCLGIIATAQGQDAGVHFVSRFFEPRAGVPEDPVTGSAHCTLIPYWAEQLKTKQMIAKQRSTRGGTIFCEMRHGGRVGIGGHAVLYSRGELLLPA